MLNNLNKVVSIGETKIGNGNKPYVIAEMACAHNGKIETAKRLINATAEAGANATQLQFFDMGHVVTPKNDLYETLNDISFSHEEWTELFHYAKSKKLDVFICTYDTPSVELAVKLGADGIKLNSSDLSNPEVIQAVAESAIPFTLGTGASTLEEIYSGLETAVKYGAKNIILMHGVQNFPTQIEDLNISRVELLKEVFEIPVGYHDHVSGEDPFGKVVDLIAVGLGANIIEKHITIDRSEKGLDYQAALEPNEFKSFTELLAKSYSAYGSKQPKPFSASDIKYRKFQKKSIVAVKDLKIGDTIKRSNVHFSRNNEPGLPPTEFELIAGKKVINPISQYDNILLKDIEE